MRTLIIASLMLAASASLPAWAKDGAPKAPDWSLGGAAFSGGEAGRMALWESGSVAAGVGSLPPAPLASQSGKGMQVGGFLAWRGEGYRIDATIAPSLDRSVSAGLGAVAGAQPGDVGTSYGVRLGAAWSGDHFTVNPGTGLGLSELSSPTSDINLTFTVNHALTPSLSVTGTAEARRVMGGLPDGNAGQRQFLLGAGLGLRF